MNPDPRGNLITDPGGHEYGFGRIRNLANQMSILAIQISKVPA
jgi:hypothetical protein